MSHVKIHHASDSDGLLAELGSAITLIESQSHIKAAASSSITRKMLDDCAPPKDHFLAHVVAMGGSRKYGFNKNADLWPSMDLEKRAHTFVTHGRFYREHRNRGAHEGIGQIKAAAYDPDLDRVELAVWGRLKPGDGSKLTAEKEYEDVKAGKPLDVSMSARVAHDVCSICGHKAKNRKEYCEHAKKQLGKWHEKSAKFVYVSNPNPTFFDISAVGNRADRIARMIEFIDHRKAASADASDIVGGAELAELEGIALPESVHDKIASALKIELLEKLAAAETDVVKFLHQPGTPENSLVKLAGQLMFAEHLNEAERKRIVNSDLGLTLRKMARARAILPFEDFYSILYDKPLSAVKDDGLAKRACSLLPGVFGRMLDGSLCSDMDAFDASSGLVGTTGGTDAVDDVMNTASEKFSVDGPEAAKRVMRITITIGLSDAGPVECVKSASHDPEAEAVAVTYGAYKLAALTDMARIHGANTIGPRETLVVAASNFR